MRSLPAAIETQILLAANRPVTVYELAESGGTTLRYSSQALPWGGNPYTALTVRSTPAAF